MTSDGCSNQHELVSGRYIANKALPFAGIDIDMSNKAAKIYGNTSLSAPDSLNEEYPFRNASIEISNGKYFLADIDTDFLPAASKKIEIEVIQNTVIAIDCALLSFIFYGRDFCHNEQLILERMD